MQEDEGKGQINEGEGRRGPKPVGGGGQEGIYQEQGQSSIRNIAYITTIKIPSKFIEEADKKQSKFIAIEEKTCNFEFKGRDKEIPLIYMMLINNHNTVVVI